MSRYPLAALLLCLALAVPAPGAAPLWTHDSTAPVRGVALSADGSVVAVSSNVFHVFDRNGTLLGTSFPARDLGVALSGEPAVAGTDDTVYAFARNGSELWEASNSTAALAVSGDGETVVVLGRRGDLAVYDADGALVGTASADAKGEGVDVAVSKSGSVIAAAFEGGVRAFNGGGGQSWAAEQPSPYAVAVNASGAMVAVGDGGSVTLYNRTGKVLRRVPAGGMVRALAAASADDLVVAGSRSGTLVALRGNGSVAWRRALGAGVNRVAASESGGVVAAAAEDGALLLYDRNGTMLWEERLEGEPSALALSADGTTVAAGSYGGMIYLFETGVTPEPTPTKAPRGRTNGTANRAAPAVNGTSELNAGDLAVTGNLTVGGNLTVTGDLRARGAVTAGGAITVLTEGEEAGAANGTVASNGTAPGRVAVTEAAKPVIEAVEEVPVDDDGTVSPGDDEEFYGEDVEVIYVDDGDTNVPPPGEEESLIDDEENLTEADEPVDAPSTPRDGAETARTFGDLVVPGNYTVDGDLTVGGEVRAGGNLTVGGTLTAASNRTLAGNATATAAPAANRTAAGNRSVEVNATAPATPAATPAAGEAQASWFAALPWNGANATPAAKPCQSQT